MTYTGFNGFFCRLIVRIRVSDRQNHLVLFGPDKFHGALYLRCDIHQFEQSAGLFLQTVKHFYIRSVDVFPILSTFFLHSNKRTFHIDAAENGAFFILMISGSFRNLCQLFFRKCHGCRNNGRHTHAGLIIGNCLYSLFRSVAEISAHASMKMNICQSGNQITPFPVQNFPIAFAGSCRFFCKLLSAYGYVFLFENTLFRINFCIPDNHHTSPFSFRFSAITVVS